MLVLGLFPSTRALATIWGQETMKVFLGNGELAPAAEQWVCVDHWRRVDSIFRLSDPSWAAANACSEIDASVTKAAFELFPIQR
jgi:hypothetical protein